MAISTAEAQTRILEDLAAAIDQIARAVAVLGEAFEQLPEAAGERLEAQLFRPAQRAYARGKRTHAGFADRTGLPTHDFELPSAGLASQGASAFVDQAATAATDADRLLAELQDSMLPVESGDADLRAGLADVRELLDGIPAAAREFQRTLGR